MARRVHRARHLPWALLIAGMAIKSVLVFYRYWVVNPSKYNPLLAHLLRSDTGGGCGMDDPILLRDPWTRFGVLAHEPNIRGTEVPQIGKDIRQ